MFNGENFTGILRWNLDDPMTTTNPVWGLGVTITGYEDRANFTQPFAAEDIILVGILGLRVPVILFILPWLTRISV
jgi:hypothetical protein